MPVVTIILPTHNRSTFLPEAFASILAQTWTDWELIVVDDGSTDDTRAVVDDWIGRIPNRVIYTHQQNKGAYGARNTGLDQATGQYIAFFDSDDLWLPEYLERCVTALRQAPEIDWVFVACRCIDGSGHTVQETTFETSNGPRPFVSLRGHAIGDLNVIDDPTMVECHLTSGMYAGLQNSVIKREVFDGHRFWEQYRVVEDAVFLLRAMLRGIRLGYLRSTYVIYRIHSGNSSGSAAGISTEAMLRIRMENVTALERVREEAILTISQRRALRRSLARHYFWDVGYACCLEGGDLAGAFHAFRKGIWLDPLDLKMWKTLAVAIPRRLVYRMIRRDDTTRR
jgi:glycosyltransferase involved in cell wall biosynthesis